MGSKPRLKASIDMSYVRHVGSILFRNKGKFQKKKKSEQPRPSPAFLLSWKTAPFPSLRCSSNVTNFEIPFWFPQAPFSVFPDLFIIVPEIAHVTQHSKLYGAVSPH